MSLRRKKPGKKWVTGIPRAQFQKIIVHAKSILAQDVKTQAIPPGGMSPLNDLDRASLNAVVTTSQQKLAQVS